MEYLGILEQPISPKKNGLNHPFYLYTGDFTEKGWNKDLLIPIEDGDSIKVLSSLPPNSKMIWEGKIGIKFNCNYPEEFAITHGPLQSDFQNWQNKRKLCILIK